MRAFLIAAVGRDLATEFPRADVYKFSDAANAQFQLWDTPNVVPFLKYNERQNAIPLTIVRKVADLPRFFLSRALQVYHSGDPFDPTSLGNANISATKPIKLDRLADVNGGRFMVVKRAGARVCVLKSDFQANTDKIPREFSEPVHMWAGVDDQNLEVGADDD